MWHPRPQPVVRLAALALLIYAAPALAQETKEPAKEPEKESEGSEAAPPQEQPPAKPEENKMMNSNRTICLGENGLARLACDLGSRQAALDRFRSNGGGSYQARAMAESMRQMVEAVRVTVPFRTGSHVLEVQLKQELVTLADALRDIPSVNIDIEAHTDVRGSRRFNRKLAFERARAVRHVFLCRGVPLRRITARAVGVEGAVYAKGDRGGYAFDRATIVRFEIEEPNR